MTKKLLITGANGFVGSLMQKRLQQSNAPFIAVPAGDDIDIRDRKQIAHLVRRHQPDAVIHLAAQSFVPAAFDNPAETFDINFYGTLNLLQALQKTQFNGRVLFIGSGDTYGLVTPADLPLTEKQPLKPRNPYSVSKVAAEALCYQWSQSEGMDIVMARAFNHFGPQQSSRFVMADFASQIARIRLGQQTPVMQVGDIDVARDFTDVRDVIEAYITLLQHGQTGEVYNVCSEKESTIRSMLEQLIDIAGCEIDVQQDPRRLRKSEQRRVCASYAKLNQHTGWKPTIACTQTLQDTLHYWETELG